MALAATTPTCHGLSGGVRQCVVSVFPYHHQSCWRPCSAASCLGRFTAPRGRRAAQYCFAFSTLAEHTTDAHDPSGYDTNQPLHTVKLGGHTIPPNGTSCFHALLDCYNYSTVAVQMILYTSSTPLQCNTYNTQSRHILHEARRASSVVNQSTHADVATLKRESLSACSRQGVCATHPQFDTDLDLLLSCPVSSAIASPLLSYPACLMKSSCVWIAIASSMKYFPITV